MRRLLAAVGCAAVMSAAAADLAAQARGSQVRFGLQGSWGSEDINLGIGGRVVFGLRSIIPAPGWEGVVSFDYFFPDAPPDVDATYWELNGNVAYLIPNVRSNFGPYVGGGLNIAHLGVDGAGSDTEVGLNVLGGVKFKSHTSRLAPFLQLRAELGGGEILVLSGGVDF